MSILSIQTAQPTGLASVTPSVIYILTSDTFATVTTTGYLTQQQAQGFTFDNHQMALVYTTDQGPIWLRVVITYSGASVLNTVVSLVDPSNAGDVVLPTVANYIAHFTGTTGTISSAAANVINPGNIQAGLSATAGYLASFPSAASKGSLRLTAVANTNDTVTTISNAAMGQASVISIPDPGAATANFLVSTTAAGQTIAGGLTLSTGNLGVTLGNITAAAGAITATLGAVGAGTTVTAGTGITSTTGNITASAGNVIAGASGAAGTHVSFPTTAANGSLILAAVDAGGAFNTTISNGTMGQSTVYTIPDVAAATGQFLAKTAAFVNGNLIQASGTAGVTVDSGVATTNVQLKTDVKAAQTADIGGAGAGPINIVVAGVTAASVIVASVVSSTNTVAVAKVAPGAGSFDITFTADPGAACVVSYVAYIAAQ